MRERVALMNGTLEIESKDGQGTTIFVKAPVMVRGRGRMTKLRILLADDHETVREGLRLIIGAQPDMEIVCEVGDGRAAVDQAEKLRPDIVVMDVSMPKLNGLKATQKLKQCCPEVKVLALTRHKDDGYLQQILRAGASGYVLKQSSVRGIATRHPCHRRWREISRSGSRRQSDGNLCGPASELP